MLLVRAKERLILDINYPVLYAQFQLFSLTLERLESLRILLNKDENWQSNAYDVLMDRQLDVLVEVLQAEGLFPINEQ